MLWALYDWDGGVGGRGFGLAWNAFSPFATMDRSILGPSLCACVETAVWQCGETAGGWGGYFAAGDRNRLPPQQTLYLGEAAVEEEEG